MQGYDERESEQDLLTELFKVDSKPIASISIPDPLRTKYEQACGLVRREEGGDSINSLGAEYSRLFHADLELTEENLKGLEALNTHLNSSIRLFASLGQEQIRLLNGLVVGQLLDASEVSEGVFF